jgi:hypothetical protein
MGGYWYKQTEPCLWTVGQDFNGRFEPESDWGSTEEAAARVRYLNGGALPTTPPQCPPTVAFAVQVGMMHADDYASTPTGSVVIAVDARFVGVVTYKIERLGVERYNPSLVRCTSMKTLTIGVDSLPSFTNWCDRDTAEAIATWMADQGLPDSPQWGAFCELCAESVWGPGFYARKYGDTLH